MFKKMPATLTLIVLCVAFFLISFVMPANIYNVCVLTPAGVLSGCVWELITSMFMHSGITHLLCNMISLYCMGMFVEGLLGTKKFLITYFASGIAGGLVFIGYAMMTHSYSSAAVGASGAIFGLLGVYAYIIVKEHKRNRILMYPPSQQDVTSLFVMIAINVFISLTPGIAWEAHLGGLVCGALLAVVFYQQKCKQLRR